MSPTSYQTAPPRGEGEHLTSGPIRDQPGSISGELRVTVASLGATVTRHSPTFAARTGSTAVYAEPPPGTVVDVVVVVVVPVNCCCACWMSCCACCSFWPYPL